MNNKNITQGHRSRSISNGVKSITRFATVLVTSAMLVIPSLASAAQIYSDSNGNFMYNSPGFSIGFGSGVGMGFGGPFMCGASNICQVASTILYIINYVLVPVLFALAFIVFLYGVFKKYIWSRGDETAVEEGHKLILWGLIGFVVMISLWGLVNVVANTFGLYGISAPPTPRSY